MNGFEKPKIEQGPSSLEFYIREAKDYADLIRILTESNGFNVGDVHYSLRDLVDMITSVFPGRKHPSDANVVKSSVEMLPEEYGFREKVVELLGYRYGVGDKKNSLKL